MVPQGYQRQVEVVIFSTAIDVSDIASTYLLGIRDDWADGIVAL